MLFKSQRPNQEDRRFCSKAVEEIITEVKSEIKDEELAWIFENAYPNTLDTTVYYEEREDQPDTYVITGDIDAMWLRDSTAQVWPYLDLVDQDEKIQKLIKGLIYRQTEFVLRDPYANSFYKDPNTTSIWSELDKPEIKDGVHERKWEIDSLCYVVRLAYGYYQKTQDTSIFTEEWTQAMRLVLKTFKTEQRKDGQSPYWFERKTVEMIESPTFRGTGRPVKPVGLIASMFRPSDDATLFPFLIPSNIFAMISLRQLVEIYQIELEDQDFVQECKSLADEIDAAVQEYAVREHLDFGKIYAYEIDGYGNQVFMDDANVPSLISLAYLDPSLAEDPIYQNTREFLLSDSNPYFLTGKVAEGQGSPHTGKRNIWPMGIILRAMTSSNEEEIIKCLQMLKDSHAMTGFMHESFDKDDASNYTRDWFAWANTLFGELIIKIYNERPKILKYDFK